MSRKPTRAQLEAAVVAGAARFFATLYVKQPDSTYRVASTEELRTAALAAFALTRGEAMSSPTKLKDWLVAHYAGASAESFMVLFLDSQLHLIEHRVMFQGTLSQSAVYPREVVKAALELNAANVMFAHNHPSGEPAPSMADKVLTNTLKDALAMVDCRVLDHVIVAGNTTYSFAEHGLI